MLKSITFPFDEFTSINEIEKIIIKFLISIASTSTDIDFCRSIYFLQYILLVIFCIYNTYIILYKSYYLMNNESNDKARYSNLLSSVIIETVVFFMKPEEIYGTSFIIILLSIYISINIIISILYNPYNNITIDVSENKENLYYYFFLLDRNKNISVYLFNKIEEHISKCGCCSLCLKYQKFNENKDIIEIVKNNNDFHDNEIDENIFNILYSGKDNSLILINELINSIKKLGNNCLYNNAYFTIKFTYIYYYSLRYGDIIFSLNMALLFDLILEHNQNKIVKDKILINQIIYINEFLNLYKQILSKIKEIISKKLIKTKFKLFFELSKKIIQLNSTKFKDNLFMKKMEENIYFSYILNLCSLLYEEMLNKSISSNSISIREDPQLIEEMLKNFGKQNNHVILKFNLKTLECKIIFSGFEFINYIGKSFYDLFPDQIKEKLINNFSNEILYSKQKKFGNYNDKNIRHKSKKSKEISLIIKNTENNTKYLNFIFLKLNVLFNYGFNESILLIGYYIIHKNTIMTIKIHEKKERILGFGSKEIMNIAQQSRFIYQIFLESDYMKNKKSYQAINITINGNEFYMYIIKENKIFKQKIGIKKPSLFQLSTLQESKIKKTKTKKSRGENIEENILRDNINHEQENTENENIDNSQKNKHLIEDGYSQSSILTKSTLNSVWNINKIQSKDNQNNLHQKNFSNCKYY
jgi:hypothetical protein